MLEFRRTFSPVRFGAKSKNCGDFEGFSDECSWFSLQHRLSGGARRIRTLSTGSRMPLRARISALYRDFIPETRTGETYRDRPHDELVRFRRPSEWRRPGDHRAPRRCSRADSSLHRVRKWLLPYRAVRSAKRISRIGSSTRGPKTRVRGTFGLGSHFSGIITSPKPTSGSE